MFPKMTTKVYVAIYKKLDPRDAAHWALWLQGVKREDNVILQTGDEKETIGYFVEDPSFSNPQHSNSLDETVECGGISSNYSLEKLIELVQSTPVNNKSHTWNCQNWVMLALDALSSKCCLKIEASVRETLMRKRENPKYENANAPPHPQVKEDHS